MKRRELLREIDLLAYADGLLDADVVRKRQVEQHLAENAGAAAFVAEIKAQNEDIRAHYGPLLYEPVPEHLTSALHASDGPSRGRRLAQVAAAIALLAAASLSGWLIGQRDTPEEWGLADFVERAASVHHTAAGGTRAAMGGDGMLQPLGWLNQRIDLQLRAPDLADYGFNLVAKERVGPDGDHLVRLVYQRRDGTTINLLLRPRWQEASSRIGKVTEGDVSVHYWQDGPLAFAMTTNLADAETEQMARAVRQAIGRTKLNDGAPAMAQTPAAAGPAQAARDRQGLPLRPLRLEQWPHEGARPPVQVN
jgi:anti-sigma factor RsiW